MTGRLPAIVLAAGASTRMGAPKALLEVGVSGQSFVERIVATLTDAGVGPVVVVTRDGLAADIAARCGSARVVVNPDPDRGQLSSLLTGLDEIGAAAAVLVTLVDLPLVRADTVRALGGAWRASRAPLVRPVSRGRHGHPVVFGAELIAALGSADPRTGAKPVVRLFLDRAVDVPVDDEGAFADVDTPEDYARLTG